LIKTHRRNLFQRIAKNKWPTKVRKTDAFYARKEAQTKTYSESDAVVLKERESRDENPVMTFP